MKRTKKDRIDKFCPICGKNFGKDVPYAVAIRVKTCSTRCGGLFQSNIKENGPKVVELRRKGYSWAKVGEILGFSHATAWEMLNRYEKYTGRDYTPLFEKYGHSDPKNPGRPRYRSRK